MQSCIHPNCPRDGNITCKCDYNLRFCSNNHFKSHFDSSTGLKHSLVLVNDLISKLTERGMNLIQNLKLKENLIICKTKNMIKTIENQSSSILSENSLKIKEIERILMNRTLTNKIYHYLKQTTEIIDTRYDMENFNEVIKSYLRFQEVISSQKKKMEEIAQLQAMDLETRAAALNKKGSELTYNKFLEEIKISNDFKYAFYCNVYEDCKRL